MRLASCHRLLCLALVFAAATAPSVAAPIPMAALLEGTPPSGLIANASFLPSAHPQPAREWFQGPSGMGDLGGCSASEHVPITQLLS